jgi:molybdopterin-guanine dinucleotide biosynthesis protein A
MSTKKRIFGYVQAGGSSRRFGSDKAMSLLGKKTMLARALRSNSQVVVAKSGFGLEPLCACWSVDAAPVLQAAFDAGVRKVTETMKGVPLEVLDESEWKRFDTEGRLFWNMNTPADFEEARRIIEEETR